MGVVTRYNREPWKVVVTVTGHGDMIGRGCTLIEALVQVADKVAHARGRSAETTERLDSALIELIEEGAFL